jgi:hypothetical protein
MSSGLGTSTSGAGTTRFLAGIRTQFSRTEGSGAPLRRDAVSSSGSLCCPEFFFGTFRFSFRSVFRLKRESPTCSFGAPEFPPGSSELDRDALRLAVDRAVGGAVEGGAIWSIASDQASSFVRYRSFFQSYPQVVDNSGVFPPYSAPLRTDGRRRFRTRDRVQGSSAKRFADALELARHLRIHPPQGRRQGWPCQIQLGEGAKGASRATEDRDRPPFRNLRPGAPQALGLHTASGRFFGLRDRSPNPQTEPQTREPNRTQTRRRTQTEPEPKPKPSPNPNRAQTQTEPKPANRAHAQTRKPSPRPEATGA